MKLCLACGQTFSSMCWRCPNCGDEPACLSGFPAFAPDLAADVGFKDACFGDLFSLEASHFWFRARNKLIIWAIRRYFPAISSLLEIGCGTGFVLAGISAAYPHLRLAGSEISVAGLIHAAKRVPGVTLFQMDARAIPFFDEFDLIGAFDVLEHIEEDEKVLAQAYRAIRAGGGLLITVPQHKFLWSLADVHACHVRRYTSQELAAMVQAAGFKILRMTSFVSLLFPIMLASRLRQRRKTDHYDPLSEFRISALANCVLEQVMSLERRLIQSGLNLPFGGLLMMIARKD